MDKSQYPRHDISQTGKFLDKDIPEPSKKLFFNIKKNTTFKILMLMQFSQNISKKCLGYVTVQKVSFQDMSGSRICMRLGLCPCLGYVLSRICPCLGYVLSRICPCLGYVLSRICLSKFGLSRFGVSRICLSRICPVPRKLLAPEYRQDIYTFFCVIFMSTSYL